MSTNDSPLEDKSVDELLEIFKEDEHLLAPFAPKKEQKPKPQDDSLEREKARLLEWARNEIEQYKNRIRALEALIAMLEGIDPREESQYVIVDLDMWKEMLKKKGIDVNNLSVLIGWIKSGSLVARYYARLVLNEPIPLNEKAKKHLDEMEQSLRKKQLASGRRKDLARVEVIAEAGKVKEIRIDNIYSQEDLHIAKVGLREVAELLVIEAPDLWLRMWLSKKPFNQPSQ